MPVYIAADNMITSLGFSTEENMRQMIAGKTGLRNQVVGDRLGISSCISLVNSDRLHSEFHKIADAKRFTRLERMAIISIRQAIEGTDIDVKSPKTIFVISTTKGNIDLLENPQHPYDSDRVQLWRTAREIGFYFGNPHTPVIVSNACISGVLALITAHRLLESSSYENAVVLGGDIVSEFVAAGFQSFKALSAAPCMPYDKNRDGLNLGEGCGTMILTSDPGKATAEKIVIRGGSSANDANHISGPSRDGEGLYRAIRQTLKATGESVENIGYISGHGTATPYNDDMESLALNRMGLDSVPINSLKGYFGHTLGAAGVLESIVAVRSMSENLLVAAKGFQQKGTAKNINIICENQNRTINHSLKMASGFGGCNAGILFSKEGSY